MGWDPSVVPDPQDPETFRRSKLDWEEADRDRHARLLARYRRLTALRRSEPDLTDPRFTDTSCTADEPTRLFTMRRGGLTVAVNFGDDVVDLPVDGSTELLFTTGDDVSLDEGRLRLPAHAGALVKLPS